MKKLHRVSLVILIVMLIVSTSLSFSSYATAAIAIPANLIAQGIMSAFGLSAAGSENEDAFQNEVDESLEMDSMQRFIVDNSHGGGGISIPIGTPATDPYYNTELDSYAVNVDIPYDVMLDFHDYLSEAYVEGDNPVFSGDGESFVWAANTHNTMSTGFHLVMGTDTLWGAPSFREGYSRFYFSYVAMGTIGPAVGKLVTSQVDLYPHYDTNGTLFMDIVVNTLIDGDDTVYTYSKYNINMVTVNSDYPVGLMLVRGTNNNDGLLIRKYNMVTLSSSDYYTIGSINSTSYKYADVLIESSALTVGTVDFSPAEWWEDWAPYHSLPLPVKLLTQDGQPVFDDAGNYVVDVPGTEDVYDQQKKGIPSIPTTPDMGTIDDLFRVLVDPQTSSSETIDDGIAETMDAVQEHVSTISQELPQLADAAGDLVDNMGTIYDWVPPATRAFILVTISISVLACIIKFLMGLIP